MAAAVMSCALVCVDDHASVGVAVVCAVTLTSIAVLATYISCTSCTARYYLLVNATVGV
jgi:hypothetical protein